MIEITPQYLASQGLSHTFPERFWTKVDQNGPVPPHRPELDQCWVWIARLTDSGYGRLRMCNTNRNKDIRAHVASWILTVGPITDGLCVLHHCDNPRCVRPSHLWLGTRGDNIRDCIAKNRHPTVGKRGESHLLAVLTEEKVLQIRDRYKPIRGIVTQLAKEYGVSIALISMIVHNKIWTHQHPSL